jgi:N-acetylglucosamine kinase
VRLDNDANCFALSEAWDDEFRQYPLVMGLILGTGVGGGIVINGKPITGRSYITGEFGHIRLPVDALEVVGRDFPLTRCGCGQHGCIENYLSGRGFAWLYEHFYHQKLEALKSLPCGSKGMRRRVSTSSAIWICWRCVWEIFSPSSTRICW